jgi:hypothetical protein
LGSTARNPRVGDMKRSRIGTVSLLALSLVITRNGAYAQTAARADVPFSFNIGTTHMPAGTYKVKRADFDSNFIMVSNINTGDTVLSEFQRETPSHVNRKLIFHHRGNQYFLAEVWRGDGSPGMAMPATRAEQQVEIARAPVTPNVEIALR